MTLIEMALAKIVGIEARLARWALAPRSYSFSQDYVSDRELPWIEHLREFRGRAGTQLLEIGSHEGRSVLWFLKHILTDPSSGITCVDPFLNRMVEIRFDHNIGVSGQIDRVTKIKAGSRNALRLLREDQYNIIYIDGSHTAADVHDDARLSWALLKSGGVIIFDDYLWNVHLPPADRPQMAIDEFLAARASDLDVLHHGYQVIVRRRVS